MDAEEDEDEEAVSCPGRRSFVPLLLLLLLDAAKAVTGGRMPEPLSSLPAVELKAALDPPAAAAAALLWPLSEEFLLSLPTVSSKLLLLDGGEGGCGWRQQQ